MLSAYGQTEGERDMHVYEPRRRPASQGQMAIERTHLFKKKNAYIHQRRQEFSQRGAHELHEEWPFF